MLRLFWLRDLKPSHVMCSGTIVKRPSVKQHTPSLLCSLQRQRIQAIETEIEGYRKSISKAQEQNEQITLMHNKIEADISMVKKLIGVSRNKQEVLKTEYSKYTRALHETEQQLSRAETVSEMLFIHKPVAVCCNCK